MNEFDLARANRRFRATQVEAKLKKLIDKARAAYDALTPEQKAIHDRDQRRSFVRGMAPLRYNEEQYREHCARVEELLGKDGT